MLFQSEAFQLVLNSFMLNLMLIVANLYLIYAGRTEGTKNEKWRFFSRAGTINILWIFTSIYLFILFTFIVSSLSPEDISIMLPWKTLIDALMPSILSLITFGFFFLLISLKDTSGYGVYLKYSGVVWIILALGNLIVVSFIPPDLTSITIIQNRSMAIIVLFVSTILARLLFLIYAILRKDICLIIAASLFTIDTILSSISLILATI